METSKNKVMWTVLCQFTSLYGNENAGQILSHEDTLNIYNPVIVTAMNTGVKIAPLEWVD